MKRILVLFLVFVFVTGFIAYAKVIKRKPADQKITPVSTHPSPSVAQFTNVTNKQSLFVPYWSLSDDAGDFGDYDQLLYFGIMPAEDGIDYEDAGYRRISQFTAVAGNSIEKLLVLRMLDSKLNFTILDSSAKQDKLIKDSIGLAKEHGFSGVVLDLELSALPFDSLIGQINAFNKRFYDGCKTAGLSYLITMYGDAYYRLRPFDLKKLSETADYVMIMAYDLFKAGGNPGPNFPLSGQEKYGYDYAKMLGHFLADVPAEKLNVIFGLYGYDWQVDDKNIAQKPGIPLSYLEIKSKIIDNCLELKCRQKRDELSAETTISYISAVGSKHTVWFEDSESVESKKEYLKKRGIMSFSFWANSYF